MNDSQLIEKFNWQSKVEVGGFINLRDLQGEVSQVFEETIMRSKSAWPEGWEAMPSDEEGVRAFRKAAEKVAKKLKAEGVEVSLPFARVAYGEGGDCMRSMGYVQYHSTIIVAGVKLAVHWWGGHDPEWGFHQEDGSIDCRCPKIKIENQAQLDLVLSYL